MLRLEYLSTLIIILLCTELPGYLCQDICPPAEQVAPCRCSSTPEKIIRCENLRGRWDIKAYFESLSPLIDSNTVFDKLELVNLPIFEIPAGSVETLKFLKIDVTMNDNLEYISPDTFQASRSVTTELSLWNNYLNNDAPYERDIYDWLSSFPLVESIWIPGNRFTSVPDNAFGSLPALNDLYLGSNSITTIGDFAFSNLTNLTKLYLNVNNISNEGLSPFAFTGISSVVDIDLQNNPLINRLDEDKFKPLLDAARIVAVGRRTCGPTGCSYARLDCDDRADWICDNVTKYEETLKGFLCIGGVHDDVWKYCQDKANGTGIYGYN